MAYNKAIFMGNMVNDPEMKITLSGVPCLRFRIAVSRRWQGKDNTTDFFTCAAWRNTAEFIAQYFRKGDGILIEGQVRNNNYTTQSGEKRYGTEILVSHAGFVGNRTANGTPEINAGVDRDAAGLPQQGSAGALGDLGDFEEILSDGEPPF